MSSRTDRHGKARERSRSSSGSRTPPARQSHPYVPRNIPEAEADSVESTLQRGNQSTTRGDVPDYRSGHFSPEFSRHDEPRTSNFQLREGREGREGYVNPLFPRTVTPARPPDPAAPDVSVAFVRDIPLGDFEASHRYLQRYPQLTKDTKQELQRKYYEKAIEALRRDTKEARALAYRLLERFTLIKLIQSQRDSDTMKHLIDGDRELIEMYNSVLARAKADCEKKAAALRLGPAGAQRRYSESQDVDRHAENLPRDVGALVINPDRFHRLEPRRWSYFRPGRVFAIRVFSEWNEQTSQSADDQYSIEHTQTTRGTTVTEKVRRYVVVKARAGFCHAIPINTYGGRGLAKPSFREVNINSHSRIHMSNSRPVWLQGEPQVAKRDIIVDPEDSTQRLHPASRICFERTNSIDYNEPIMKLGTVTPETMAWLTQYYENESNRQSDHGNRQPRRPTGPEEDPETDRTERRRPHADTDKGKGKGNNADRSGGGRRR